MRGGYGHHRTVLDRSGRRASRARGERATQDTTSANGPAPSSATGNRRRPRGSIPRARACLASSRRRPRSAHSPRAGSPGLSRRDASLPLRYCARTRWRTLEQESPMSALAGTTSLRSLAADFGVSHETIQAVLRQHGATAGRAQRDGGYRVLRAGRRCDLRERRGKGALRKVKRPGWVGWWSSRRPRVPAPATGPARSSR
jgi:hypothetical protein